jgi:hypothetical protein
MNNKNEKELYIILDEALERVLAGEDIQLVLADYPRVAGELEPLLRTALSLKYAAIITPRPEYRNQAALDFQQAIQRLPVSNKVKASGVKAAKPAAAHRGLFGWGTAWSIGVAVVLVVLLSGTGVVTAANYAMPDNPLYAVKLAAENVQLALTPSSVGKAELISRFNDRRVNEVVAMADKGLVAEIGPLNTQIASNMVKINDLANNSGQKTFNDNTKAMDTFGAASYNTAQSGEGIMTAPRVTPAPTTVVPAVTKNIDGTQPTEPATTKPQPVTSAPPPTLTVQLPPHNTDIVILPPPANTLERSSDEHSLKDDNKWTNLEEHLSEKQIKNLRSLLEAYAKAPDDLKPALREAIRIIIEGYNLSESNSFTISGLLESYGLTLGDLYQ